MHCTGYLNIKSPVILGNTLQDTCRPMVRWTASWDYPIDPWWLWWRM